MTLGELYARVRAMPTDMQGHMDTLVDLATGCEQVVELGVRDGVSTVALMQGRPTRLMSVDILPLPGSLVQYQAIAAGAGVWWSYVQSDSLLVEIPECDLLMIDTLHTHDQLYAELERHAPRVRPGGAIVLHDTSTYGWDDEPVYGHASPLLRLASPSGYEGLRRAILRWRERTDLGMEYGCEVEYHHCHGLMVLRRAGGHAG